MQMCLCELLDRHPTVVQGQEPAVCEVELEDPRAGLV